MHRMGYRLYYIYTQLRKFLRMALENCVFFFLVSKNIINTKRKQDNRLDTNCSESFHKNKNPYIN